MSPASSEEIDYETAYEGYLQRFQERFGDRPAGAFVKFGKTMVQRLSPEEFPRRLDHYVKLHKACKHMLEAGSTISDALVLDFVEASAWVAIEAPNMYAMFRGELGDPRRAAPTKTIDLSLVDVDKTDPDVKPPRDTREDGRITLPIGRK